MTDNCERKLKYRLGLDLGSSSLGWAMVRLDVAGNPCAVIRAGSRIFSDGREAKTHESLAVARRQARQMRRTRDRKLRRKYKLINQLVNLGFFPNTPEDRRKLETLDPYELRVKALDSQLSPQEFARALFHLAQRRGFKSNRKTDAKAVDEGLLKSAIRRTKEALAKDEIRTIGEWLLRRRKKGYGTRARLSQVINAKGKKEQVYDLYLERSMVLDEFEQIWQSQERFAPELFTLENRNLLRETIFYQRPLARVRPGRCTLIPDEERAALALPSQQRFRIYQEVNNLRKLDSGNNEQILTLEERNKIVDALEHSEKRTFTQIRKLIKFDGQFNLEDEKRKDLKGNLTSSVLSKESLLGPAWHEFPLQRQDEIVEKLLETESEEVLISWLMSELGVDEKTAKAISDVKLPPGYGSLSKKALDILLPVLSLRIITYDKAVIEAGFESHSQLTHLERTGELLAKLPYYGEYLQRHVGFGTANPSDSPEVRYGKIANPTVHIALNQLRLVVNALIKRYGRPEEIIVEVARELKLGREAKQEIQQRQAENQKRREVARSEISKILNCESENVSGRDIDKWLLWEELDQKNSSLRMCPYSGIQISASDLLSPAVEIDHILPFSRTLDDSRNNKVVCFREANRIKGNRTPWEARLDFEKKGWSTDDMLCRAERMSLQKRFRFSETGYQKWLRENDNFVARALTDTQYMSRIAREYLLLICPRTRSIPGQMTALLRGKFGLNNILGENGQKNRNDHRHHAVDACVIAVTDQRLLQRFAHANAVAKDKGLDRLIENMPMPWPTYFRSVERAIQAIKVSHRPNCQALV